MAKSKGSKQNGGVTGRAKAAKAVKYPVTKTSPTSMVRKPSDVHGHFKGATKN